MRLHARTYPHTHMLLDPFAIIPSPSYHVPMLEEQVIVLGIPFDAHSSFRRGPALAPAHIRAALNSGSSNMSTESGLDLDTDRRWQDKGDLQLAATETAYAQIEPKIGKLLAESVKLLSLGGDHSVTYPIVRAHARKYPGLMILHIDAHPDLYDEFEGNRYSHACPFARIMEEGLAARLVQVGIRTMNPHQREQARRFGVETVEMKDWNPNQVFEFEGPLYISLDMDGLDPAFAPGVSHHEPGGLTTRDVLRLVQHVRGNVVGADIVEYNPLRDVNGVTAMVAGKFYKELIARML